jgi:hypothetical protein
VAQILELVDVTGPVAVPLGSTATLTDSGKVLFEGNGVQQIFAPWLRDRDPDDVFRNMVGWSNGYVALRERK